MKERSMRQQVCQWLIDKNFIPVFEVHLATFGATDIVAGRFAYVDTKAPPLVDVMAIELKVCDIAGVLRQATNNRHIVPWSYAAMPASVCARMRKKTQAMFWLNGIGLLSVGDTVTEIVAPKKFDVCEDRWQMLRKRLWRRRDEWQKRLTHAVHYVRGRITLVESRTMCK